MVLVKQICQARKFRVYTQTGANGAYIKFNCSLGPFFASNESQAKQNACPFHLIYRLDRDEDEFFLDCYDEMHNHMLCSEPRIMPSQKKALRKPTYTTPAFQMFEEVNAADQEAFKTQVQQLARERCFDLNFGGVFGQAG